MKIIKTLLLATAILLLAFKYSIGTIVVTVGDTATALPTTAKVGRKYIEVHNIGSSIIYIGDATVSADETATGGIQLVPRASWREPYDHTVVIYAIVATGTCKVVVEEGK